MNPRLPIRTVLAVLLAATLTGEAPAGATEPEIDSDLRERICLVIFNAIRNAQGDDLPAEEAMDLYRTRGRNKSGDKDGVTYAYRLNPEDPVDGRKIFVDVRVVRLKPGHIPKLAASWDDLKVGDGTREYGDTYYREVKRDDKHRSATYFNLARDGINLTMRILRDREDNEGSQRMIDLAWPWWQNFVDEAERNNLFDRMGVFIGVRGGAPSGVPPGQTIDGGLLRFMHRHNERVELPLEVWGESVELEPDEPYVINIASKLDYGRPGISIVDKNGGKLRDSDDDGRPDITVPDPSSRAAFKIVFDEFDLRYGDTLQQQVLDQMGYVRFYLDLPPADDESEEEDTDDAATSIRLSREGGWWPVVTRFELVGRTYQPAHDGPAFFPSNPPETLLPNTFNGERVSAGALLVGWRELKAWACTRPGLRAISPGCDPFTPQTAVPAGWRLKRDGLTFMTSEYASGKPVMPAMIQGGRMGVVIDLRIVITPPADESDIPAPDLDGIFTDSIVPEGSDGGGDAVDGFVDPIEEERRFREDLIVNDIKLTLRRITDDGIKLSEANSSARALEERTLAERIRLRIDGRDESQHARVNVPELHLLDSESIRKSELEAYFPIDDRDAPLLNRSYYEDRRLTASGGLFELRLHLNLTRRGEPDRKEVDVALRYNVYSVGLDVLQLEGGTQRVR